MRRRLTPDSSRRGCLSLVSFHYLRLRASSMGMRNLFLPIALVILASALLLDRGPFGGRFFV